MKSIREHLDEGWGFCLQLCAQIAFCTDIINMFHYLSPFIMLLSVWASSNKAANHTDMYGISLKNAKFLFEKTPSLNYQQIQLRLASSHHTHKALYWLVRAFITLKD